MNTTLKLAALILVIIGLSSCGKMGELDMKIGTTMQVDIV